MTREHVIPSFIYAHQKAYSGFTGWSERAGKVIEAEQKIKDVCAECNNVKLGALDGYAKDLLENAGLLVPNYLKRNIVLDLEFHKFSRWMLKVSFNSARCQTNYIPVFHGLEPYILDGISPPIKTRVAFFCQLLNSHEIDKQQGAINPFVVRLCWLGSQLSVDYTVRLNIFGPLATYIMFFEPGILPGHAAAKKRGFMKLIPNAVEITLATKLVQIEQSSISWFHMWEQQLRRQRGW